MSCYLAVSSILLEMSVDALGDLKKPTPLSLQSVFVSLKNTDIKLKTRVPPNTVYWPDNKGVGAHLDLV